MPKRSDIDSVLVLGAGPIVIGQACEFDYSGTQACRALREEGIRVMLLNSNPATIMTDPDMADATYIAPVNADVAAAIIAKEKPAAVLPTMGGQTALNCAMELERRGVFADGKTKLIGASAASIRAAEDREEFKQAMSDIGLQCAPSVVVDNARDALAAAKSIGFPIILRPSFTLGGSGGGVAYNAEEFKILAAQGMAESPTGSVLLEKSLLGWKEFELEAVRDSADNCIIVCSIENLDPMGVHTGDSITVAPAQTLTDKEYQRMRNATAAILRKIGVDTGGANVQFAVNPQNGDMAVIEMNPRVSRSSALASKATGFPIAKVAAKLAVGHTLDEIQNDITGGTPASFEPSIDYIVVKAPRFDFAKFAPSADHLTTQMRSVGEVMAMGATFSEALQKALRGLEIGARGFHSLSAAKTEENVLRGQLSSPNSLRIFAVAEAFAQGMSVEEIHQLSGMDPWFLREMREIAETAGEIEKTSAEEFDALAAEKLLHWKRQGFSDAHLARLLRHLPGLRRSPDDSGETAIVEKRATLGVHPIYRRVDTCAGEFPTETAYFYSTYFYDWNRWQDARRESGDNHIAHPDCELRPTEKNKIAILGGGPNRIGQGIEFDYCCIHGVAALKEAGYETLMLNCNPETVSTDYDTADRLFFEPLTAEDVWEIYRRENPRGLIAQFGGQTPLSIARPLQEKGAAILGTSADNIDRSESRERFQQLIKECKLRQPQNAIVQVGAPPITEGGFGDSLDFDVPLRKALENALAKADEIGYPLVARPSYVLGGQSMRIAHDDDELREFFALPGMRGFVGDVLLDKFLENATEVDVDAVRDGEGNFIVAGVMEHIEKAGVHSGDSACCLPPHSLSESVVAALKEQTQKLADALQVCGMMNVQFAVGEGGDIFVLEVNPRASRTAPFVSKATGLAVAKVAAKAMAGISLTEQKVAEPKAPPFFAVKEAVFPFNKFPDVDVLLGPEMKSTGETMGIGDNFAQAFWLAQEAILSLPREGAAFVSVPDSDKPAAAKVAALFHQLGFKLLATRGSAAYLQQCNLPVETVNKVKEGRPHIVDAIVSGEVQIVVNTETAAAASRSDSFSIRRAALAGRVIYYTTVAGADAAARGLQESHGGFVPRPLQQWQRGEQ